MAALAELGDLVKVLLGERDRDKVGRDPTGRDRLGDDLRSLSSSVGARGQREGDERSVRRLGPRR